MHAATAARPTTPSVDRALSSPAFFADPHPLYERLRARWPAFWSAGLGRWVVTRYADVAAGLRRQDLSNAGRTARLLRGLPPGSDPGVDELVCHFGAGLLYSDPPRHTVIRRLVAPGFDVGEVARLRPLVASQVDALVEAADAAEGPVDVVADLALPLAISVMGALVGVPERDRAWIKDCCDEVSAFSGGHLPAAPSATRHLRRLYGFLDDALEARAGGEGDDLLARLLGLDADGRHVLGDQEVRSTAVTLLIAGYETTVRLIGNGVADLLSHPEQLEAFRRDPDLAPRVVEEVLRYDGPFDWILRRAKEDVELAGAVVPRDDLVALSLLSANRDPAQFEGADTFDVSRAPQRHLAFGSGPHFCLGAPIARLEAEVALTALVQGFPGLRLAGPSAVSWREDHAIRGAQAVRVVLRD